MHKGYQAFCPYHNQYELQIFQADLSFKVNNSHDLWPWLFTRDNPNSYYCAIIIFFSKVLPFETIRAR
jgi:hypothetical protein